MYAKFIDGKLFIKNKEIDDEEIRAADRSTILDGLIEEADSKREYKKQQPRYTEMKPAEGQRYRQDTRRNGNTGTTYGTTTQNYRCPIEVYEQDIGKEMKQRDYGERDTQYKTQLRKSQQAAREMAEKIRYSAEIREKEYPRLTSTYKTKEGIREWLQRPREERRREWRKTVENINRGDTQDYWDQVYYNMEQTDQDDLKENEYLSTWYPQETDNNEDIHWD